VFSPQQRHWEKQLAIAARPLFSHLFHPVQRWFQSCEAPSNYTPLRARCFNTNNTKDPARISVIEQRQLFEATSHHKSSFKSLSQDSVTVRPTAVIEL
jgi:hypothetical protein